MSHLDWKIDFQSKRWIRRVHRLFTLLKVGDLPLGRNKFLYLKANADIIRTIVRARSVSRKRQLLKDNLPLVRNLIAYYSWI